MTRKRIEELLAKFGPRTRRRYRAAISRVRDRWTLAKLETALEAGGGAITEVLDDVERAGALFAAQTEAVTVLVANEVAAQLSTRLDTMVSYDGTNTRAVEQMRSHRVRLVQGLRDEQRDVIADALAEGNVNGINPRQQAIGIRDSLGLTPKQAQWVRNYRRRLETLDREALTGALRDARFDGVVDKAIKSGTPLPKAKIDKLVSRFYDRAIRYRSEVIARTESLRAIHAGAEEMYEQSVDSGTLARDLIVQTWHATRDGRTRTSHAAMNQQKRRLGDTFTSGNGYPLKYPGDPDAPASETAQCRCSKATRVYPDVESARAALAAAT